MKIVFLGTPEFASPILEALASKYEVVLAVSQPNRVKKKGVLLDTPVASKARELGIPLFQPEAIKDDYEAVINCGADVMITAAYGQYIPTKILNKFPFRLNVHGSLLPKRRGGAPIQRAIMEGDKVTGVTIMEMVKSLDAGKMYAKREYEIKPTDTSTIVFNELSIIGRDLLMDCIEDIYNGKLEGIPQDESQATYCPNIAPEEEMININESTNVIINKIRALADEVGAYLVVGDIKLKIFEAVEVLDNSDKAPGTVLETKKKIVIKTKDSAIELTKVLFPGKKIMSGKDFSNGQKIFIKDNLI